MNKFLFSKLDLRPLAWFRIAMGTLLLAHSFFSGAHWLDDYGPLGMAAITPGKFYLTYPASILDLTQNIISVEAWWWIQLGFAIAWLFGFGGRVTGFCLYWIISSVYFRNLASANAEQGVFRYALLFATILPVTRLYSVDAYLRNRWRDQPWARLYVKGFPVPGTWALRSIQIHIALVYPISTLWKLFSDPIWIQGEALYWIMINEGWSRFPWPKLFLSTWITRVLTWTSLLIEGSFIFTIWVERFRKYVVLGMMGFHFSLAITLANITYFSLCTAACLVLFLRSEDFKQLPLNET